MNYKKLSFSVAPLIVLFSIPIFAAGGIKGRVLLEDNKNSAGVLVYIEYVDSTFTPPKKHALIDQKNLLFSPEILPILSGTTVDFLNSDNILHNVFTPTRCAGHFNLGVWSRGEIRSHDFTKSGCIATILCNVHPDMQAWIAVLQNPFFTQTNKNGEFEIRNIPPGSYKLKVWNPFYNTKTIIITVTKTSTLVRNFYLERSE